METTPPSASGREAWMRRAGPFFALLVAADQSTRLTLAADLSPTPDDSARAEPWAPVVGVLLGLGLGFIAALIAALGIGEIAVAALVASMWVVATGAQSEVAVAGHLERLLARPTTGDMRTTAAAIAFTLTLVVSLLLRAALVASIDSSSWTAALLVSGTLSRVAPLLAAHGANFVAAARGKAALVGWPVLGAIAAVLVGLPLVGGSPAFVAVAIAVAVVAVGLVRRRESDAPTLVFTVELATLVCFAASASYPLFEL